MPMLPGKFYRRERGTGGAIVGLIGEPGGVLIPPKDPPGFVCVIEATQCETIHQSVRPTRD